MNNDENVETMYLYTEVATDLIYEVKLFDDFALVRPANPDFYEAVQKVSMKDFIRDYEQYSGDWGQVRRLLAGSNDSIMIN